MGGEATGELDVGLEEPVVQRAGLGDDYRARTPGFAAPVARHADDQAHGIPLMLADAVSGCQRAPRAAPSASRPKIAIRASVYRHGSAIGPPAPVPRRRALRVRLLARAAHSTLLGGVHWARFDVG